MSRRTNHLPKLSGDVHDDAAEHRELYRLASSGRSATGLTGITDPLVEQVDSF
jgi:hypothetical protein